MVRDVILLVSQVVQFYYYFFHIHLNDNTCLEALCRVLCSIYMHTLWIFVNTAF